MRGVAALSLLLLLAPPAVASSEKRARPPEKVWVLNNYLRGTPSQIREQLQRPVREFVEKTTEARRRVASRKAEVERVRQSAAERARGTPEYAALSEELVTSKAALDRARARGTTAERLAASTAFNRVRAAIKKLEDKAASGDPELPELRRRLAEEEAALAACAESLAKARAWRDTLVDAIAQGAQMRGRLEPGLEGTLGKVKVVKATPESLVVEFFAAEETVESKTVEGIERIKVVGRKEKILLDAADVGQKVAAGDSVRLDRNFVIVGSEPSADDEPVFTARRKHADCDDLLETVLPLMGT